MVMPTNAGVAQDTWTLITDDAVLCWSLQSKWMTSPNMIWVLSPAERAILHKLIFTRETEGGPTRYIIQTGRASSFAQYLRINLDAV